MQQAVKQASHVHLTPWLLWKPEQQPYVKEWEDRDQLILTATLIPFAAQVQDLALSDGNGTLTALL